MSFRRIETILLPLEVEQYAGKGQEPLTIERITREARAVEALGFDAATTPEAGHDPFLPITIAAEHTRRIVLATNVAIAFPRSPLVVAQIAWDLQQYSGGRFQLGLGTQVKGHNERRYVTPWNAPPGPRLREYIQCLRAMFQTFQNGSHPTYFEGQHYRFTMMPPFFNPGPIAHPMPPIYIAAVNRYMVRLAGELCDGLRLHPIATFDYTRDVVLPTIDAGAKKAGRRRADVDVIGAPFLAIGKDAAAVAKACAATKQRVAFYGSTRTYHAAFEHHGWLDIGQRLHQMSIEGKWQEMPKLVSDEMLEQFAIVGTYDELAAKVKARCDGVFSTVLLDLPPDLRSDQARVREILARVRAT
jgi:probable F420-dependent oxidoreductase